MKITKTALYTIQSKGIICPERFFSFKEAQVFGLTKYDKHQFRVCLAPKFEWPTTVLPD